MAKEPDNGRELAIQFLGVRKAIGTIGLLLPWILLLVGLALNVQLQPTISDYHGTAMRDVFVGLLCANGVFLLAYRGYGRKDFFLSQIAGGSAIVVAFFPNMGDSARIHVTAAAVFFVTLALISLFLFTKTDLKDKSKVPNSKKWRNRVYRACGIGILLFVLLIATHEWWAGYGSWIDKGGLVFWLETGAVELFGISWLVKGDAMKLPGVRVLFKPLVDRASQG